jgi:hypothetical protein
MDDKSNDPPSREANEEPIEATETGSIVNPGTKKRNASTPEPSDRPPKAHERTASQSLDDGAENVIPLFLTTPSSKRMAAYASLRERESIILAADMESQIQAEARGVTRKNVPWNTFRSIYLRDFSVKAQPKLTESVKKVGEGNWEESLFFERLSKSLSNEALRDLKLYYGGTKTLPDANKGKEVPSKPDFVLHVGEESPPMWANVELLFEHTQSRVRDAVTKKFSQWLRGAWSVFHHQPFRLHLYGIMFIQPCAFICYADHGCAVYSEPLHFAKDIHHTQFLAEFLTGFIANPEHRGKNPTVEKEDKVYIRHAEKIWVELPNAPLCYRPCLIGRNIRVALVRDQCAEFPEDRVVMKSTWEEILPSGSSPPSEVEVLEILLKANVRGLPQPYFLEDAIVKDDNHLDVETCSFPKNCKVALPVANATLMEKMQKSYVSNHTSKPLAPGANVGDPSLSRVKVQDPRQQFNNPLEVRRRLTRVLMSYCVPLKEAMRARPPKSLMRAVRDAMIVYYEAYKLPATGFIHGGKYFRMFYVLGANKSLK